MTQLKGVKYSEACLLEKQVDDSIEKLTNTVVGPEVTNAVRTRLEVAHVSGIENWTSLILIDVKDSGFSPNPYSSHFLFISIYYSYFPFM